MKQIKILSITLALMLAMSLFAGCGQDVETSAPDATENASDEPVTIGVTMETLIGFLVYNVDGMKDYENENPDKVKLIIQDANRDQATQIQQVENLISKGCDAIVVKPITMDGCGPITDMCRKAGVKLIATNVDFNSDKDTFIGSDHRLSGQLEAEYVAENVLNGKGNVAILVGKPDDQPAIVRTEATKEVLAKYPDIKIVAEQTGQWVRDNGMKVAENWIQSGLDIDCIISNNDEMAIGAALAYKAAGKEMKIAGIDATADGLNFLKEGLLCVTVFQNGAAQGYQTIDAAYKLVKGESVPKYIDVPFELVPPEKVDEYIAKIK